MTATVRNLKGVTHFAIHRPNQDESLVIGAMCEVTLSNFMNSTFTTWTADEVG